MLKQEAVTQAYLMPRIFAASDLLIGFSNPFSAEPPNLLKLAKKPAPAWGPPLCAARTIARPARAAAATPAAIMNADACQMKISACVLSYDNKRFADGPKRSDVPCWNYCIKRKTVQRSMTICSKRLAAPASTSPSHWAHATSSPTKFLFKNEGGGRARLSESSHSFTDAVI